MVGSGSWSSARMCSAMTQLIMCAVRAWRQVRAVVVDGVVCVRGERQRRVGGADSSSESSSMMAGRSRRLGEALVGDLLLVLRAGCWTSSGFQITTGSSSSMMGRGVMTGGGVGAVGGTLPRRSVCRAWIVASSLGRASCTPSITGVRRAIASRILLVVGGSDSGDQDGVVVEPEGVRDALASGVGHYNSDAAVVVGRMGKILSFGGVVSPSAASVGFHVNKNLHAEGSHGRSVEREGPSRASWAERRGFCRQGQSMLRVASHCLVRRHQLAMGKDFGRPAMPKRK